MRMSYSHLTRPSLRSLRISFLVLSLPLISFCFPYPHPSTLYPFCPLLFLSRASPHPPPLFMSSGYPDSDRVKRERSRSPRRRSSRSPRRSRRSYSPRSRSRSRDDYRRDRRSRSPLSASGAAGQGSPYGGRSGYAPGRFEDRTVAKENMMQSVRDSSQQDRRVYVGNLSYDVKWHHLKDFMRQGEFFVTRCERWCADNGYSWRGSLCRCVTSSEWNVEGGRQCVEWLVPFLLPDFSRFGFFAWTVGLTGWAWPSGRCRDAGEF